MSSSTETIKKIKKKKNYSTILKSNSLKNLQGYVGKEKINSR